MRSTAVGFAAALLTVAAIVSRPILADDAAEKHGPIAWTESLPAALKTAEKEKKPLFIDFWAEWCGPCKQMLATTYRDKAVVEKSKEFVPVLINTETAAGKELVNKYKFESIPTVIFLNPQGKEIARSTGRKDAKEFLKLMDDARKKAKS